jgi:thiamine kinase-like enzyme
MTADELKRLLRTALGWSEPAIIMRPLPGGTSGRTQLLCYRGERYILRTGDANAKEIRPRMSCEPKVLRHAARADLGPELVHADTDAGLLVTRYLDGRAWTSADLQSPPAVESLAELLRAVHQLPRTGEALDVAGFAEAYRERLSGLPEYVGTADRCMALIASGTTIALQQACCHNDVVAANIIEGRGLRLIDWEYAGDNDPFFDLASVIGYHDLPQTAVEVLLQAYTGRSDSSDRERLREQLRLFEAVQWLWLAARQARAPDQAQAKRLSVLAARLSG